MKNRRSKSAHAIALFPFLAVLICTMGTLILLLVIEMTQVRADMSSFTLSLTQETETTEPPPDPKQQQEEEENYQWRLKILQQQRDDMSQKLAERRLELGHLDEHAGRLRQGLEQLKQQVQDLENAGKAEPSKRAAAAQEEAQLREKIATAERDLAAAKENSKTKPRSYAVVPYDGPNGTLRRPIYVECTGDAIVIQPEGVRLTQDDFAGPLDAGNPLDASLRVIREYMATHGGINGAAGEPYPLLLVRPDGAWAYAYARGAMKSWDAEFGYELLDADMQLAYPPVDPGLRETLDRTVVEARRRQQRLIAAAPARYRGAGGGGGNGGSAAGGGGGGGFARAREGGGFEVVDGPVGFPGTRAASGGGGGDGAAAAAAAGFAPRSSQANNGDATGQPGSATRSSDSSVRAGGNAASPGADSAARAGSNTAVAGVAPGSQSGSPAGQRSASGGAKPGGGGSSGSKSEGFAGVSFSKNRGQNWGLPNSADKSIPITRPIRAACSAEKLVLVPERADYANATEVRFEGDTRAAVDRYVNVVWKYMETWGIAGSGMYWKPVLRVDVSPDGEQRFAELTALLQGSGIGIERVQR